MLSLIPTLHPQFMNHVKNILHAPLYTDHSSYNHTQPKQIIQGPIDIQTQHSLAQHLAQAEGSRSGEPPPRLGESTKTSVWATRDLA